MIPVRCGCSRRPLLAMCGRDTDGKGFVHVKSVRSHGRNTQPKIFTEAIVTEGIVHLHCRECLHWLTIRIVYDSDISKVTAEGLPDSISTIIDASKD